MEDQKINRNRNLQLKNGMIGTMGFIAIGSGIWATGWTLRECEQNYKKEGGDRKNVEVICYCFEADSSIGDWPFNYDGNSVGINADKGKYFGKTRVYLRLKGKLIHEEDESVYLGSDKEKQDEM